MCSVYSIPEPLFITDTRIYSSPIKYMDNTYSQTSIITLN